MCSDVGDLCFCWRMMVNDATSEPLYNSKIKHDFIHFNIIKKNCHKLLIPYLIQTIFILMYFHSMTRHHKVSEEENYHSCYILSFTNTVNESNFFLNVLPLIIQESPLRPRFQWCPVYNAQSHSQKYNHKHYIVSQTKIQKHQNQYIIYIQHSVIRNII